MSPDPDPPQPETPPSSQDGGQSQPEPLTSIPIRYTTLFRIMYWVVIAAFAAFLVFSYSHLASILSTINQSSHSALQPLLDSSYPPPTDAQADQYLFFLTKIQASLESDVVANRHKRAATALNSRTWMRAMSLAFGAVLSIVGAAFVLGGITFSRTEGKFRSGDLRVELASRSPGLFILVLGVVLILAPNFSRQSISIDEKAIYLGSQTLIADPSAIGFGNNPDGEDPNEATDTIDVEHLMPQKQS